MFARLLSQRSQSIYQSTTTVTPMSNFSFSRKREQAGHKPSLMTMPAEVYLMIFKHLSIKDLKALRSVCNEPIILETSLESMLRVYVIPPEVDSREVQCQSFFNDPLYEGLQTLPRTISIRRSESCTNSLLRVLSILETIKKLPNASILRLVNDSADGPTRVE